MRVQAKLWLLGLALVMVALLGCGGRTATLSGDWRVTGWSAPTAIPADVEITARFAEGSITGRSGVNQYSSELTLGPGDAFQVGDVITTLMAGPEPAMQAEETYLDLLQRVVRFQLAGDTLTLYDEGGEAILTLEQIASPQD
ncbi:MAG: META domain-containing protein [Anaerolineae bacterium]|jgi:heat shock protein HslJ|nr:META domain-containing protein [Chloroflexota bacterium]